MPPTSATPFSSSAPPSSASTHQHHAPSSDDKDYDSFQSVRSSEPQRTGGTAGAISDNAAAVPTTPATSSTIQTTKQPQPPRSSKRRFTCPAQHPQEPFQHRRTATRLWNVKKKHRTEIAADNWDGQNHFGRRTEESLREIDFTHPVTVPVERISRKDFSVEEIYERYMLGIDTDTLEPNGVAEASRSPKPFVVEGCMDHWPAMSEWSLDNLSQRFPHQLFKVGEDDDGRRLRIKFKYFADYCRAQRDDSPVYLFQSALQEETRSDSLLDVGGAMDKVSWQEPPCC